MIRLTAIDSTNNYAMQLIDADKAAPGATILAERQTAGKGQRGRHWQDVQGESVLMSIIAQPAMALNEQPAFLARVAAAVAAVVAQLVPGQTVRIKWPNDIIIGDKKAGGMLIENVVRGAAWQWAVIGIGLNVLQTGFPAALPHATSLAYSKMPPSNEMAGTASSFDVPDIAGMISASVLNALAEEWNAGAVWQQYNALLYRRDKMQRFAKESGIFEARILEVLPTGELLVECSDGSRQQYAHGSVEWLWA